MSSCCCSSIVAHHPGRVDQLVRDRDAHEAVAVGRAVGGLVVEDVDVLGREEVRVVAQPDRKEDGLVVDHREGLRRVRRIGRVAVVRSVRRRAGARRRSSSFSSRRRPRPRARSIWTPRPRPDRSAPSGSRAGAPTTVVPAGDVVDDDRVGADRRPCPDPHRPDDLRAGANADVGLDRRALMYSSARSPIVTHGRDHDPRGDLDDAVDHDLAMDDVDAGSRTNTGSPIAT